MVSLCNDGSKTKLLPLCRTRWIERLNTLDITLDLSEVIIAAFSHMVDNTDKQWNRDTVIQASALLKRFDLEFLINLVVCV